MNDSAADILELFDYVWERFRDRMAGLSDAEWEWQPTPDDRISIRWRLQHIAETLSEPRNGEWLGVDAGSTEASAAPSAIAALAAADRAFRQWRGQLASLDEHALSKPIGGAAGQYGDSTRRSFALHIADELVHHGAEVALLRDLYASPAIR